MSLGSEFKKTFDIDGTQWIAEAEALASKLAARVPLTATFDHALLVGDRFVSMAGPLEALGYAVGSDETLYLGEVEGLRYLGVSATLAPDAAARAHGWFEHVLISQPAHLPASEHLRKVYDGGPVLHHVAIAVDKPARPGESDLGYARRVVPEFLEVWAHVAKLTGAPPQKVTMSLPAQVLGDDGFRAAFSSWTAAHDPSLFALEEMMGGGFFLQFATSDSYRVEVVLRHGTKLGFNPVAQTKLSRDVSYGR